MADTPVPALPTISPDTTTTTASAPELPAQPAPDPRDLRLLALRAGNPGERLALLSAGAGDNAVSFGAKLPSAAEWAIVATDLQGSNAAAAELALRRAVVGATPEETVAERARLESVLDEDPPLGDYWGMQLLASVGMGAKITTSPKPDAEGRYELRAELPSGGEVVLHCKKRSRPQWGLLRDVAAKKGPQAFASAAYEMLVVSANKADVAQLYPALVSALGDAAASAGSRAETGAPFGLPR